MKLKGHTDNVKSIVINSEGTQVSHFEEILFLALKCIAKTFQDSRHRFSLFLWLHHFVLLYNTVLFRLEICADLLVEEVAVWVMFLFLI